MSDGEAAAAATLSLLQACHTIRDLHQIHAHIIKTQDQHRRRSSFLPGRLVAATCSHHHHHHMDYALSIFSRIPSPDTFTHNCIINAYLRASSPDLALLFFSSHHHNFLPNSHTLPLLLKSACLLRSLPLGAALHSLLLKLCIPTSHLHSHTALLSLYSSSADPATALRLFATSPHRSLIAPWNALISGFAKSGHPKQALDLFHQLLKSDDDEAKPTPDEITIVSALTACTALGALDTAKWVHEHAAKSGIPLTVILGTALVDAYAKCGSIELARMVFDEMPHKNVMSWTAMIWGLAMLGHGDAALALFSDMIARGVTPDDVTFVGVLSACSHSGLVNEGRRVFNSIVSPKGEHYGCMVDLLSRAGLLDEALGLIESMPLEPDAALWGSLLSACRRNPTNLELAEYAAGHLIELEPNNDATYVLLSNIYARHNRWDDVARLRGLMKAKGIGKTPGCSSIEVGGMVHEFIVGDKSHPCIGDIYAMVEEIQSRVGELGYVMDTSEVLLDIEEHEKRNALLLHSEKLALAFGLIGTVPPVPVRIVKNIRVCNDCHLVMKLASRAFGREIILRDRNRFHRFREGSCTCGDFW